MARDTDRFDRLRPGQVFESRRTFSQSDFDLFARLSGDDNPIHVDPGFAANTGFGCTVSHGMLLYSCLCGTISEHLPGAVQVDQDLMFPTGTPTGEEVTFRLTVQSVDAAAREAIVETLAIRPNGENGLQGQSTLSFPKETL